MIEKSFLPGLNINSDEAKTHLNNFWSYLDDLAENNPEEYRKFIGSQMKKGIGNMKNEMQLSSKEKELEVQSVLCLRFKPTKLIKDLEMDNDKDLNDPDVRIHEKADIKEVPQIRFSSEFQSDAFSTKVIQNRKIYLNILKSKEYFSPTDEKGEFLSNELAQDVNNWRYIPTEFRYNGKKMSISNIRCDFYDVILNTMIIGKMNTSDELYKSILGYICRKFAIFLNDKVELYMKSVKIISEKTYKSIKPKPEIFQIKASNVGNGNPKTVNGPSTASSNPPGVESKNFYEENKIIIPGSSENYPNTSTFYNKPNDQQKKEENKILIQEIESKSINKLTIPFTKKILSSTQLEIKFDFGDFEYLNGINEIDLQISENGIIIHLDNPKYIIDQNYEPIEMAFDCKMDPEQCKAKYNKKEKILTVVIVKSI